MGRINRGDGDGGDPARSPSGHASFRWPNRLNGRASQDLLKLARPLFAASLRSWGKDIIAIRPTNRKRISTW